MEKTKLIGTMGPASENKDILREIFKSGLNVARMNFSHGDHNEHLERLTRVKELNQELKTNVAIMLDTKGPEIRTHSFENGSIIVNKGDEVKLFFEEVLGNNKQFSVNYSGLFDDVNVGTTILFDDGYLQTTVIDKNIEGRFLILKAHNTHLIKNRRGVNVPNTKINIPFLSDKDRDDIVFGAKNNVDFIAASFVQTAENIREIKKLLEDNNASHIQIVAKIENQTSIDNIDEILEVTDGVMYARGDLGVEILPEDLPHIQKLIVEKTRQKGKLIIVATQMIESMQNNPTPTRAEVSDVANAVYDGADSVMLSGEMAAGKYPLESVKMMKRIVTRTEAYLDYSKFCKPIHTADESLESISYMATVATNSYNVKAVIVDNMELAMVLSKYRVNAYIIPVVSFDEARKLNVYFANYPVNSLKEVDEKLTKLGIERNSKVLYITNDKIELKTF